MNRKFLLEKDFSEGAKRGIHRGSLLKGGSSTGEGRDTILSKNSILETRSISQEKSLRIYFSSKRALCSGGPLPKRAAWKTSSL